MAFILRVVHLLFSDPAAAGGTPPGTPSSFQFNDAANSQNVGPMA